MISHVGNMTESTTSVINLQKPFPLFQLQKKETKGPGGQNNVLPKS